MFDNLSVKLEKAFQTLKGQGKITEINVAETMKEIRKALLDADVNYKTAKAFTDEVKEKALGQNVLTSISPGQLLTKIMNDELTELMGGTSSRLVFTRQTPNVVMIVGLQGSGKTTSTGKIARWLAANQQRKPLLLSTDVYRPAAREPGALGGGRLLHEAARLPQDQGRARRGDVLHRPERPEDPRLLRRFRLARLRP